MPHTPKTTLITGLDIGSSKITAVLAETDLANRCAIRAHLSVPSRGVTRGVITDLDATVGGVSKVLERLAAAVGRRVENIYVAIGADSVRAERSRGMIPLSVRGREVTRADMERCVNVASTIRLPFDREIIHKIVRHFSVDDQPPIANPLGLYASRLSCETYVITANLNALQTLCKCINNAGYETREAVYSGIADAAALLSDAADTPPTLIVDIGHGLTAVSFISAGALCDLEVIPSGTSDIKGALTESAELKQICARIRAKIDSLTAQGSPVSTMTLTGGIVFVDGIVETIEQELGRAIPISVGVARDLHGAITAVESMQLVTAIGLVKYGYRQHCAKTAAAKNVMQNLSAKVVDIFNNYF